MNTENSPTERPPGEVSPPRPAGHDQAWVEYVAALRPIAEAQLAARERQAAHARQLAAALVAADTELRRVAVRRSTVEGQFGKITEFTRTTLAEADISPDGPRAHIPPMPIESVDDVGQAVRLLTEQIVHTTNLLRAARERATESARLRQRYLLAGATVVVAVVLVKAAGGSATDAVAGGLVVLARQAITHFNRRGDRAVMTSGGVALGAMVLVTPVGGSWPVGLVVRLIVSAIISRRK